MAYSAKVGSFNLITTGSVGTTQSISGLGFQPKIVLFWWGGSTGTSDIVSGGNISYGFGAAVSATSRFVVAAASTDAAATSATIRANNNTQCIRIFADGTTASRDGIMDFGTMDADGFTLVVDDQFTQAYRISYLALGGTDLTNVYLGSKQLPATTGEYSVTGVGFQADAILFGYAALNSLTTDTTITRLSIGWATAAANQGVVLNYMDNAAATSNTSSYGYNGEVISSNGTTRNALVSIDADGFTLNNLEGTLQNYFNFVAIKGGQYSVGDITTRMDGNDIAETVGFSPIALLFASVNSALSTQDIITDHARMSIGAATSTTERACAAISDEDNLADTETAFANYDSAVYAFVQDDATVGLMDIKSIDASGFTCVMDDADPSASWVTYLAIGATGGVTNITGTASITLSPLTLSSSLLNADNAGSSNTLGITSNASVGLISDYSDLDTTLGSITNVSSGAGAIGGSSDETLGTDTFSSEADVAVVGNLNQTLGDVTLASSGTLATLGFQIDDLILEWQRILIALLTKILDSITSDLSGKVAITASSSDTSGDASSSSSGSNANASDTSITLGSVSETSSGVLSDYADLDKTLADVTLASEGSVSAGAVITATLTATLGEATSVSSGTVAVTGTAIKTLDGVSASSLGKISIGGSTSTTLGTATLSSNGTVGALTTNGELNVTLGGVNTQASGTGAIGGSSSSQLGDSTPVGSGLVSIEGSSLIDLADLSLSSIVDTGAGRTATLNVTLAAVILVASGIVSPMPTIAHWSNRRYRVEYQDRTFTVRKENETMVEYNRRSKVD